VKRASVFSFDRHLFVSTKKSSVRVGFGDTMNKEATKEELAEQVQRLQQNLAVADNHNVELVHERNRMAEEMKTKDKQLQA